MHACQKNYVRTLKKRSGGIRKNRARGDLEKGSAVKREGGGGENAVMRGEKVSLGRGRTHAHEGKGGKIDGKNPEKRGRYKDSSLHLKRGEGERALFS